MFTKPLIRFSLFTLVLGFLGSVIMVQSRSQTVLPTLPRTLPPKLKPQALAGLSLAAVSDPAVQAALPAAFWQTPAAPQTEAEYERLETAFAQGSVEDPQARERWFWEQRAYPAKSIPADVHQRAVAAELAQPQGRSEQATTPAWTTLGPAPIKQITYGGSSAQDASGRTLAIAIHPTDNQTILVGAAQGGIWKSTNGGASFRAVADNLPTLAIKVLRYAPSNPAIVYAGTGEPHSSTSIYGLGVMRSSDGGETWQALPSKGTGWDFEYAAVSGLQIDPTNPNTVYVTTAAVRTAMDQLTPPRAPVTGIWKTTSGGQSWTKLREASLYDDVYGRTDVGFMDLEMVGSSLLYATELGGGIYKSTNAGANWTQITPSKATGVGAFPASFSNFTYYYNGLFYTLARFNLSSTYPDFSRIEIGVARSNPDVIYAGYAVDALLLDANNDGVFDSNTDIIAQVGLLFKSSNGGQTWTWLGDWGRGGAPDYCASQCGYDNLVEVNPTNPHDVIIGGNANYPSLWPDPVSNPTRMLNLPWRGMIHRSLNGGTSWIDTTPHCTGISATSSGTSNGLPVFNCTGVDTAQVIHPDSHNAAWSSDGRIYITNDGGLYRANVTGSGTNSTDYRWDNLNTGLSTMQFYFFDAHPTNPNLILGGLQDNSMAYYNGSFWDGWGFGDGTLAGIDPLDPQHVYFGSPGSLHRHDAGGTKVALTTDGNAANGWQLGVFGSDKVASGESVPFLFGFAIDPVQSNIIYATSNRGLYRSVSRGDSWARVTTTQLSGTPTTISVSPADHTIVYVGTAAGKVYRFNTSASTVTDVSAGLPNRFVSKVLASPVDANTVYVALSGYNSNTPSSPGKVFQSTNQGQSWINRSGDLPDVPVSALAVDPQNPQQIWIGSDIGVFATTNSGTSWISYRSNMPVVAILDMKYNSTTGQLMAATHGRGMWRVLPNVISQPSTKYLPLIAVNGGSTNLPTATRTPTPGGPTATRTSAPSPTRTTAPSATPTSVPSGGQLLLNPSFEDSTLAPWQTLNNAALDTTVFQDGGKSTKLLGGNGAEDEVSQVVTIPANTNNLQLDFWYRWTTTEVLAGSDSLCFTFYESNGAWLIDRCFDITTPPDVREWTPESYTLTANELNLVRGQTVRLGFNLLSDSTLPSTAWIDHASLVAQP